MNTENITEVSESAAKQQARAQARSISEMVAALNCDFDRLKELKDARETWHAIGSVHGAEVVSGTNESRDSWAQINPTEADELAELEEAAGECTSQDEARERILEDALDVQVRSAWASLGETLTPSEFRIVLCTGGPHVEIIGELDDTCEPDRVRILYRDWNESGELFDFDHDTVLTYCQQFYFEE